MDSFDQCRPGLLPQLLGCDDCESWTCAFLALGVIVAVILAILAIICFLTDRVFNLDSDDTGKQSRQKKVQ